MLARHIDRLPPGEYTIEVDTRIRPVSLVYTIKRNETVAKVGRESETKNNPN